jgi:pyrroloquinoline-quinone synthase
MRALPPEKFQERLFDVLRRKQHWSAPYFYGVNTTKPHLNIHCHQEYVVYIRDFSVLLARVLGKNPPWEVRRKLATIIYEEETGGLSLGQPHQELFHQMMSGLGFDRAGFRDVELLTSGMSYREWLDNVCQEEDWLIGATVLTVFVQGTMDDREHVLVPHPPKTPVEIEDIVNKHPFVQYHGLSPTCMDFIRVKEMIVPENRRKMYEMITRHADQGDQQQRILAKLEEALSMWSRYQEGIARACGLRQSSF